MKREKGFTQLTENIWNEGFALAVSDAFQTS